VWWVEEDNVRGLGGCQARNELSMEEIKEPLVILTLSKILSFFNGTFPKRLSISFSRL
jgi:hypothetical protein